MERVATDVALLVAAAGSSRRFGAGRSKLLEPLAGEPVVCHGLRTLLPLVDPRWCVLVVPKGLTAEFEAAIGEVPGAQAVRLVAGGVTRQESVYRGLAALAGGPRFVAVQDAARPHTRAELFLACLESARARGSGVAARRVTDTIKVAAPDGRVQSTPDRATLWAAETPQVFEREHLTQAYARILADGLAVTDDARAMELCGHPVFLVDHADPNPKITFPHDLAPPS